MIWLRAGRAFVLTSRRDGPPHLRYVLTDLEDGRVVMVMVVTARPHTDKTVTLQVGDHPFIAHESNVDYGSANYLTEKMHARALANKECKTEADMSPALLKRVRDGLLSSSRTVHEIKEYCRPRF